MHHEARPEGPGTGLNPTGLMTPVPVQLVNERSKTLERQPHVGERSRALTDAYAAGASDTGCSTSTTPTLERTPFKNLGCRQIRKKLGDRLVEFQLALLDQQSLAIGSSSFSLPCSTSCMAAVANAPCPARP
jgi:hypothetical protein